MNWKKIASDLLGSQMSEGEYIEKNELDISEEELIENVLDENVESCPSCQTWVECYEFLDENGDEDGYCDNCR